MDALQKIIARVAGSILLLLGVGIIAFALSVTVARLSSAEAFEPHAQFFVVIFFVLGSSLCLMGFRLAVNRPNKHGSLLPPGGWHVLAFLFVALAATFGMLALRQKELEYLSGVLFSSVMAWWCWTVARRPQASVSGASVPADNPLGDSEESRSGYFRLLSLRGVPIFVHVSLPIGGILFSLFAGFDTQNSIYYCVGYVLLVGAHEAGHALAAMLLGLKVFSIDISGVGGLCRIQAPRQVAHGAIVYSAGIIVQVILLMATLIYVRILGDPTSPFERSLVVTFTTVNAIMLVLNLIPMGAGGQRATDGAVLWQLLRYAIGNQRHPFEQHFALPIDEAPVFPPDTRLLTKRALVPKGFNQGIEILNDAKTPMEVVVTCLVRHLGLQREEAVATVLAIHNKGGVLIPVPSIERAVEIAAKITAEAERHGHVLVCRAVEESADLRG